MKNKKIFTILLCYIALFLFVAADSAESQDDFGVVLVAHGSIHADWNANIVRFYDNFTPLKKQLSAIDNFASHKGTEVAFLRFVDDKTIQRAINKLHGQGLGKILLVHLSPSSNTIRHEEIESIAEQKTTKKAKPWLFKQAVSMPKLQPVTGLEIKVAPAMDDHPLIVDILREHAMELSKDAENESLILLSYGPIDELENITWLRLLDRIGKRLGALGFKEVVCVSLRHHSADLIRTHSIAELQKTARRLGNDGRVIVVPYVLNVSPGDSFHRELKSCLRGIVDPENDIGKKGIISHRKAEEWVWQVIGKGMNQPKVKPVNRTWSAMDGAKKAPIGTNQYGLIED